MSVKWERRELPWTAIQEDLRSSLGAQQTIFEIKRHDGAWRFQQLLETGQDPGPRDRHDNEATDLSALVEQFRDESGYPTEAHKEQERLRQEWSKKLSAENVESLSREDLNAFTRPAVDSSKDEYVKTSRNQSKWIRELSDTEYLRLLKNIKDICWGKDELSVRIDRYVGYHGYNRETGTKGFAGSNVGAALAICLPDRFIPASSQKGKRGRTRMLDRLGIPHNAWRQGPSFGSEVVEANDLLREYLEPYFDNDTQAMAVFLHWLLNQEPDSDGGLSDDRSFDLSALVEQFLDESDYPTDDDEEQEQLREEWAEKLSSENLHRLNRSEFYRIAAHGIRGNHKYVYTGGSRMNSWIANMTEQRYSDMLESLWSLCWDDEDVAHRIDAASNDLIGTIPNKCLAICHPDRFMPIGVLDGKPGTLQMLERLGLSAPTGTTYGDRVVEANDRLREHVAPYFDDDPLAAAAFMYWLMDQDEASLPEPAHTPDLDGLAQRLLVDVEFLKDIVSLLEDKKQVILYGPPGTGKTYLARELAQELAPDEACRALVQFHPSTSYEDFFEGYRPAKRGDDGGISYELLPGPLKRMATKADKPPGQQHVMIIDEINRGNLPRVLGELLFLLEYRDESVQTLYRPEEPFSLPDNLWFIGTMNTADRSIALVDAALRRRFHFVPFFPDSGPMAGLLDRWLEREDEPAWVGHLVNAVNDDLKKELGGSHLLLGPSHFMKEYGLSPDEQRDRLRRIWEYNIEPFIEDQFFGNPDQIKRFRFNQVMAHHGPPAHEEATIGSGADSDSPTEAGLPAEQVPTGTDREFWKNRAQAFPPPGRRGGERYLAEINQVVRKYVDLALERGTDPGSHNHQLVEEFLSSPGWSEGTKTAYRRHLQEWFDVDHTGLS